MDGRIEDRQHYSNAAIRICAAIQSADEMNSFAESWGNALPSPNAQMRLSRGSGRRPTIPGYSPTCRERRAQAAYASHMIKVDIGRPRRLLHTAASRSPGGRPTS